MIIYCLLQNYFAKTADGDIMRRWQTIEQSISIAAMLVCLSDSPKFFLSAVDLMLLQNCVKALKSDKVKKLRTFFSSLLVCTLIILNIYRELSSALRRVGMGFWI